MMFMQVLHNKTWSLYMYKGVYTQCMPTAAAILQLYFLFAKFVMTITFYYFEKVYIHVHCNAVHVVPATDQYPARCFDLCFTLHVWESHLLHHCQVVFGLSLFPLSVYDVGPPQANVWYMYLFIGHFKHLTKTLQPVICVYDAFYM